MKRQLTLDDLEPVLEPEITDYSVDPTPDNVHFFNDPERPWWNLWMSMNGDDHRM